MGYTKLLIKRLPESPPAEGHGFVGREGLVPTAVSTVNGVTCRVSPLCAHMHAVLNWNDQELTWDCPAHGSRYAADGTLLEGPAVRGLPLRPLGAVEVTQMVASAAP
jgi:Rieske Fe-S protein